MSKPITCGHPDRPYFALGQCKQCYYNARNRVKRADPQYVARELVAGREYRLRNRPRYQEHHQRWYAAHRESAQAVAREAQRIRRVDPVKRAADAMVTARWMRENPDKVAAIQHRRRSRKAANDTRRVTDADLRRLLRQPCAYCGARAQSIDHIIPVARGGRHSIGNLAPACRRCNSSKRDRLLVEWRAA